MDVAWRYMIKYRLTVDDLADTRFAISPLGEAMCGLWALHEPERHPVHTHWARSTLAALPASDAGLLLALVGPTRALPDFLTPRPTGPSPAIDQELAVVRSAEPELVRRDLIATHAPGSLPDVLGAARSRDDDAVRSLRDTIADALRRLWRLAFAPWWPQMRLVLEADTTYRARQLAAGGARLLFADLHPNVRWEDERVQIGDMLGRHDVDADGRGLLLIPSLFASKPVPPLSPEEAPWLIYPSRGIGTLWLAESMETETTLVALVGRPRAQLLRLLDEPAPTIELARRLGVTPSAVSQHLRVLHANRLVSRARDGRRVLYRRSDLGEELVGRPARL